jgi:hypothetical protein
MSSRIGNYECDLSGNGRLFLNMVITIRFHTMLGIS